MINVIGLVRTRTIRKYICEHAAAAGTLPELMADPEFLLAADCTRLLAAINVSVTPIPSPLLRAYKSASLHIRTKPTPEAISYLSLAGKQNGLDFNNLDLSNSKWSTLWSKGVESDTPGSCAIWSPDVSNNSIANDDSDITSLAWGFFTPGQAVALVGRRNGSVGLWDLASNSKIASWQTQGVAVSHVTLGTLPTGDPIVLAVNDRRSLTSHMLGMSTAIANVRFSEDNKITDVALAQVNGTLLCITAHWDKKIVCWDLPHLSIRKELPRATDGRVYALAVTELNGKKVLVTGGDFLNRNGPNDKSVLRLWSLPKLSLLWADERGITTTITRIGVTLFHEKTFVATVGSSLGEIWELDSLKPRAIGRSKLGASLLYEEENCCYLGWVFFAESDKLWLLATGSGYDVAKVSHVRTSRNSSRVDLVPTAVLPVSGSGFTSVIPSHGRNLVLSADGTFVRVWDLAEILAEEEIVAKRGLVYKSHFARCSENAFCEFSREWLILRDPANGVELRRLTFPSSKPLSSKPLEHEVIKSVVVDQSLNRLFGATSSGRIFTADPLNGAVLEDLFDTKSAIERLCIARWQGRLLAFTTSGRGKMYALQIWDLESGEELFRDREFSLRSGQGDKRLYGLATAEIENNVLFAFAGEYSKVMVSEIVPLERSRRRIRDFEEWDYPSRRGTGYTRALQAFRDGDAYVLSACTEYGELFTYDFLSGVLRAQSRDAHGGNIEALDVLPSERPLLVSGGNDGFVRIWDVDLQLLCEIGIGVPICDVIWANKDHLVVATSRGILGFNFCLIPPR